MNDLFETLLDKLELQMRFSGKREGSIADYKSIIRRYLEYLLVYCGITDPKEATYIDMKGFIGFLQYGDGKGNGGTCKGNALNQAVTKLGFFQEHVLLMDFDRREFPKIKFDKYIPYIPERDFVLKFIDTIEDLEVKAYLSLLYSAALRNNEVRFLKCGDIEKSRNRIKVSESKNREQRYAYLSDKTYKILKEYVRTVLIPKGLSSSDLYLFPSKRKSTCREKPVSSSWINGRIKKHEKELNLEHKITTHTFRRACACHMAEARPDDPRMLFIIADFLGHKSLESTRHYLHMGNVYNGSPFFFSPFDL